VRQIQGLRDQLPGGVDRSGDLGLHSRKGLGEERYLGILTTAIRRRRGTRVRKIKEYVATEGIMRAGNDASASAQRAQQSSGHLLRGGIRSIGGNSRRWCIKRTEFSQRPMKYVRHTSRGKGARRVVQAKRDEENCTSLSIRIRRAMIKLPPPLNNGGMIIDQSETLHCEGMMPTETVGHINRPERLPCDIKLNLRLSDWPAEPDIKSSSGGSYGLPGGRRIGGDPFRQPAAQSIMAFCAYTEHSVAHIG
jgi:hypothetical protein